MEKIRELITSLPVRKDNYLLLRECKLSTSNLPELRSTLREADYHLVLQLASFNASGFVREYAINEMQVLKVDGCLPYLLFRLGDWVTEVRTRAAAAYRASLIPKNLPELLAHLPILWRVLKVQRVNLERIRADTVAFCLDEHRTTTLRHYPTLPDNSRLFLAHELVKHPLTREEVNLLLSDSNFMVRQQLVTAYDQLIPEHVEQLCRDKSARVRGLFLQRKVENTANHAWLTPYLTDRSANIRNLARYYLSLTGIDAGEVYRNNLRKQQDIVGSLLGLYDLAEQTDVPLIESFLSYPDPSVVKTAVFALSKVGSTAVAKWVMEDFLRLNIRYHKALRVYLNRQATATVTNRLMEYYPEADTGKQLFLLRLFAQAGGYDKMPYFLRGLRHTDVRVRTVAHQYIADWRKQMTNVFYPASPAVREEVKYQLRLLDQLPSGTIDTEAIKDLDFYFR